MTSTRSVVLSVVVLAEDPQAARTTVASIEGQPVDETVEIIVVSSTDVLADHGRRVRVIEPKAARSPGAARNAGMEAANGEHIAFLGPGSHALPGWVRGRIACHGRGHPVVAGASVASPRSPAAVGAHYLSSSANLPSRPAGAVQPGDHVRELSFERSVLERIGPFTERAGTDPERAIVERVSELGYEVWFDPSIVAAHSPPRTTLELLRNQHRRGAQAFFGSGGARDPETRSPWPVVVEAWRWSGHRRRELVWAWPWIAAGAWARRIGWARARAATRTGGSAEIRLSFPTSARNEPRYGYDRSPHGQLEALLAEHASAYRTALAVVARYSAELAAIPATGPGANWDNPWLTGLDAASLYAFLRDRRPRRYIEIGSGNSTWFAARAREDGSLATDIVSIDPAPRRDVADACDVSIRTPLEETDLSTFDDLQSGDVVFVDSSHRVFMNSDVVVFYLDVLPRLPSGVLVGVHDVYWPDDYPPHLAPAYLSEQYVLAAYLLAETPWIRPVLACHFAATRPELRDAFDAAWTDDGIAATDRGGSAFWFTIERPSQG